MIVKVQTALDGPGPALVYDRYREFACTVPEAEVKQRMNGRPKAYFHASIQSGELKLGVEAPGQRW